MRTRDALIPTRPVVLLCGRRSLRFVDVGEVMTEKRGKNDELMPVQPTPVDGDPSRRKKMTPEDSPAVERVFLASALLPSATAAFRFANAPLATSIKTANIVLDTNTLLIPFSTGTASLTSLIKAYNEIEKTGRLCIPAQVMREYLKNRPVKIADLFQSVSDRISRLQVPEKLSYPVLDGVDAYVQLAAKLEELAALKKQVVANNNVLLDTIRTWEWSDPVTVAYRKVFKDTSIVDIAIDQEATIKELRRRIDLAIPPGYKDAGKDDLGIGDFLIWKTILHVGEQTKKDVIFVSGDEKADWQHRAGAAGFIPRYELLDEYRRASGGCSFHIVSVSRFLELFDAPKEAVKEVRREEERILAATAVSEHVDQDAAMPSHMSQTMGRAIVRSLLHQYPIAEVSEGFAFGLPVFSVETDRGLPTMEYIVVVPNSLEACTKRIMPRAIHVANLANSAGNEPTILVVLERDELLGLGHAVVRAFSRSKVRIRLAQIDKHDELIYILNAP